MTWGILFLAAILAGFILAGPAAAGIKRYTDSKGVIRISNIGPAQPGQIQSPLTAAAPGAPETPQEVARPPAAAPALPSPGKPVETALNPEDVTPVVSPPPGANPGSLPLRRVAYDPDGAGALPSPKPQGEPPQIPWPVTEGDIRRFRNPQGVLVITNVTPKPPQAAPPLLQTVRPTGSGGNIPLAPPDLNAAFPGSPTSRPVSWSPDQPSVPLTPSAPPAAGIAALETTGSIRRYRDQHGVIHIENVGTAAAKPPKPPMALALAKPPEDAASPAPGPSLLEKAASPPFVGPPHPDPLKQDKPLQVLTAAASTQAEMPLQGGVRRYRDRLGIWRIETVDDRWLLEAPPLPRPAASPQQVLLAATQEVTRIPAAIDPVFPRHAVLATPGNTGGIATVRDRRGRLVITNLPGNTGSGRGQSWMQASAQLDPIIQEAARAYRLPPSLIKAVIKVESNFVNAAVSPKGAMGLMQLMPGTANLLGVEEPFNPWQNIHGGCRYLRLLIDSFGGSLPLALAGYNAGPQRVVDSGYQVPEIKETQNFLKRVLEWYFTEENQELLPPRT
ncbi:MAG: transglycosylase SLT domain-containing protein [Thermodesulfobacteriota bacterium]